MNGPSSMRKQAYHKLGILSRYEKDTYHRVNVQTPKAQLCAVDRVFGYLRDTMFDVYTIAYLVQRQHA